MVDIYRMVLQVNAPFWMSYICPSCGFDLNVKAPCHHGEDFSCPGCGFVQFVTHMGVLDECSICAPLIIRDNPDQFPQDAA